MEKLDDVLVICDGPKGAVGGDYDIRRGKRTRREISRRCQTGQIVSLQGAAVFVRHIGDGSQRVKGLVIGVIGSIIIQTKVAYDRFVG